MFKSEKERAEYNEEQHKQHKEKTSRSGERVLINILIQICTIIIKYFGI